MTFTFTAVVKATAAKFNFAACSRHAKYLFRVRLHTKFFRVDSNTQTRAKNSKIFKQKDRTSD
jgi:hypothetical protein